MDDNLESAPVSEDDHAADVNSTVDVDHTWGESFVEFSSAVEVSPGSSDRAGGAEPEPDDDEPAADENSSDGEQGGLLSNHDETSSSPSTTSLSSDNRIASAISQVQERWRQTRERAAREARAATLEELTTLDTGRKSVSAAADPNDDGNNNNRVKPGPATHKSPDKQPGVPPSIEGSGAGAIEKEKSFASLNIDASPPEAPRAQQHRQLSDEEVEELRLWHEDNPDSNDAVLMLQRHWRRRSSNPKSSRCECHVCCGGRGAFW